MPITVQQFDLIAAAQGINAALAVAEEAGGVTGTREVATQIVEGTSPSNPFSLSGADTQYMPGTVVTDASQGIGAAGTATSGDILGGGGLAANVYSPQGRNLQDIMNMYQEDTSAIPEFKVNAPVTEMPAATPAPVSLDQSILDKVMAGTIIPTSDLAQIENATIREQAATQLAKLLVAGLGNTQAAIQEISPIYQQYIDLPGMEALNFNDWAVSAGLDWAQVPPLEETPAVNVPAEDGGGVADDGAVGTFGEEHGGMSQTVPLPNDTMSAAYINEFLSGFYDAFPNNPEAALQAAAEGAVQQGTLFGGQAFTDVNDALALFRGITGQDPLGTGVPGAQPPTPLGTVPISDLASYWGTPASMRSFAQIYPGFTSMIPGSSASPAVASAYRAAEAPLETQWLARQATTPFNLGGTEPAVSAPQSWLEGLHSGDQSLMIGDNYAQFLRDLSASLLNTDPTQQVVGLAPGMEGQLKQFFGDPTAQVAAYKNPFYRATAGSPAARQAIMNQIDQAAQRYMYQEPGGQFLPWAIGENIGGIQGILPGLTPHAEGMLGAFGNR